MEKNSSVPEKDSLEITSITVWFIRKASWYIVSCMGVPVHSMTSFLQIAIKASVLKLFDTHLTLYTINWKTFDTLATNHFDSFREWAEISDELKPLTTSDISKEGGTQKDAITKLTDHMTTQKCAHMIVRGSNLAQRRFLQSAVHGTAFGLHAKSRGVQIGTFQTFVDSLFVAISTTYIGK